MGLVDTVNKYGNPLLSEFERYKVWIFVILIVFILYALAVVTGVAQMLGLPLPP